MRRQLFLVLGLLAAAACGEDVNDAADAQGSVQGDGGGTSVAIVDFDYDPAELTVAVGDTVTWTNEDTFAHTVTSDEGSAVELDSGDMEEGDTFEQTFNEAGEYAYLCAIHNYMTATVVVE